MAEKVWKIPAQKALRMMLNALRKISFIGGRTVDVNV